MNLVELDAVAEPYWDELIAGEREPFGAVGETLAWREKERTIGLREPDGRLVAGAGAVLADVDVAPGRSFAVVGLGGLIVTREARGRGPCARSSMRCWRSQGRWSGPRDVVLPPRARRGLPADGVRAGERAGVGRSAGRQGRDADAHDVASAARGRWLAGGSRGLARPALLSEALAGRYPRCIARLGDTDLEVFPLCLGGNVFGWTIDEQRSFEVLDAYVQAGGNFIDTADSYGRRGSGGAGESERIIGRWIAARGNRDRLVIATKVGIAPELPGLSPSTIARAIDASFARLGVDHVDLYYAHKDDPQTPLAETLGAFEELIGAGKIRHAAASNYSAGRLQEALSIGGRGGMASYVALQPHYNLLEREYEGELARVCERHGLACIPYFGLARGFLTGKYRRVGVQVDSPRADGVRESYLNERGFAVLDALDDVAAAHHSSPAAVALAWLLAQPTVLAPIASATSTDQLAELRGGRRDRAIRVRARTAERDGRLRARA